MHPQSTYMASYFPQDCPTNFFDQLLGFCQYIFYIKRSS